MNVILTEFQIFKWHATWSFYHEKKIVRLSVDRINVILLITFMNGVPRFWKISVWFFAETKLKNVLKDVWRKSSDKWYRELSRLPQSQSKDEDEYSLQLCPSKKIGQFSFHSELTSYHANIDQYGSNTIWYQWLKVHRLVWVVICGLHNLGLVLYDLNQPNTVGGRLQHM